jgi:hypothetical protein
VIADAFVTFFATLLSFIVDVQSIADSSNCIPSTPGGPSSCPASVFHLQTAALATQGYWVQADILSYITQGGLGTWAILIYTIAVISGIIGMAMGFPPKLYLWFLIGPGIYHWLVQDTIPIAGVRWNVGPKVEDNVQRQKAAQKEVWKNAEPGLAALNIVQSGSYDFYDTLGDLGLDLQFNRSIGKVRVSNLFVWYDTLLSDFVEWMMRWTGVFNLPGAESSIFSSLLSNLPQFVNNGGFTLTDLLGNVTGSGEPSDDMHWLLSNLKWKYLQDITGAKVSSADLRDAFTSFLSSECGDAFRKGIDEGKFVAANNSTGANVPDTVFLEEASANILGIPITGNGGQYVLITKYLASLAVPTPKSMRDFLSKDSVGGFRRGFPFIETEDFKRQNIYETVRCDQYLYLLVHAFRWEAGHIYYQMISGLPAGVSPITMMYTLFYGWPRHALELENLLSGGIGAILGGGWQSILSALNPATLVRGLTPEGQAAFLTDLILVHLFRNEFSIAPKPYDVRMSSGASSVAYGEIYQSTVGSQSRFTEVYSWAMMMPYVQGVLMYLLSIAYPFVCLFILIPGWHKILFTWMSFWAWVKLWDVGFALCITLERSIWAMLGNNSDSVKLFSKVWSMQQHGMVQVTCPSQLLAFGVNPPYGICAPGAVPKVMVAAGGGLLGTGITGPVSLPSLGANGSNLISWFDTMRILDKSMVLGAAMDLDLTNSYYIYLMAALYFAVPAVTGQIVLGAKAGAASLATQSIQSYAQETGRAAGRGYTGDLTARASSNQATVGQMAYSKAMRNDPNEFGFHALAYGNLGLRGQQEQSAANALEKGYGQQARQYSLAAQQRTSGLSTATQATSALVGAANLGLGTNSLGGALSSTAGAIAGAINKPLGSAAGAALNTGISSVLGVTSAASQLLQGASALGTYGIETTNRQRQAQLEAQQAGQVNKAFSAGGQAAGYNQAAGRQNQAAEQRASEERWSALNNFAHQASGALAAQEVQAGTLSAGQKPASMEGMAMLGMLGTDMQMQAQYSDPLRGEYFNWFNNLANGVNSEVGQQSLESIWANNQAIQPNGNPADGITSELQGLMSRINTTNLGQGVTPGTSLGDVLGASSDQLRNFYSNSSPSFSPSPTSNTPAPNTPASNTPASNIPAPQTNIPSGSATPNQATPNQASAQNTNS